jgi:hypothetical protein
MLRVVVAFTVAACGGKTADPSVGSGSALPGTVPVGSADAPGCKLLPFAESTPLHEASGAAWMTIDGKLSLVAISDSGNDGEYAVIDPDTGETRETGELPLGGGTDDNEGVAIRGGKLLAITSPGWIRVWERKDKGFALVDGPYAIGPVDLPSKGGGNKPPKTDGMVCPNEHSNCGRNYEGLCLAPEPTTSHCVGFAASKADGHLYCLSEVAGRLVVEREGAIAIARPGVIADCAFSDDGRLFAGSNLFDIGAVYRVDGWREPATAKVERIAELAIGFPETLAVRGDIFYRMSDTGGSPSLMAKYRCAASKP